jgi:hypothetical protein
MPVAVAVEQVLLAEMLLEVLLLRGMVAMEQLQVFLVHQ